MRNYLIFGERGQFFSPDLIVAAIIFIFAVTLFLTGSEAIFSKADSTSSRISSDNSLHHVLALLATHPGEPAGWEHMGLEDINSVGLATENNVIEEKKIERLFELMDNNYSQIKTKLGATGFDFNIELVDYEGSEIGPVGRASGDSPTIIIHERIVYYEGNNAILRGVFSSE